jgi:Transglutaminase-like superfamily
MGLGLDHVGRDQTSRRIVPYRLQEDVAAGAALQPGPKGQVEISGDLAQLGAKVVAVNEEALGGASAQAEPRIAGQQYATVVDGAAQQRRTAQRRIVSGVEAEQTQPLGEAAEHRVGEEFRRGGGHVPMPRYRRRAHMHMARYIVRWSIVLLWLGLVCGLLWKQETPGKQAPSAGAAVADAGSSQDTWMSLYMHDSKIGYSHDRWEPTQTGFRFKESSLLRVTVLDQPQTVQTAVEGEVDGHEALRRFSFSLRSGVGDMHVRGTKVEGALDLQIDTGSDQRREKLPVAGEIYLPSVARHLLGHAKVQRGTRVDVDVFDPSAMATHPLNLLVEAREPVPGGDDGLLAWRVRETFRGIHTNVWLDDAGRVLREEGPMGLVAVRQTAKQAMSSGWKEGAAFDLMAAIAVPVDRRIPFPRQCRRLELSLSGLGGLRPLDDARQSFRRGHLSIVREDDAAMSSYVLPYEGDRWRGELAPTPFLQVDDPRIRGKAREVLGAETDARQVAEKLRRWVYGFLEKKPTVSIPNAVQVLNMGQGDCNEHAVLFAALARAAGLPAKVVAGAVYVDGVFLYHAWNEVWLGKSWVSVDPTFDQMPVDATHMKFVEGGPEAHADLLPIIGRLSVAVDAADCGGAG